MVGAPVDQGGRTVRPAEVAGRVMAALVVVAALLAPAALVALLVRAILWALGVA